jgi:hypothetical protein
MQAAMTIDLLAALVRDYLASTRFFDFSSAQAAPTAAATSTTGCLHPSAAHPLKVFTQHMPSSIAVHGSWSRHIAGTSPAGSCSKRVDHSQDAHNVLQSQFMSADNSAGSMPDGSNHGGESWAECCACYHAEASGRTRESRLNAPQQAQQVGQALGSEVLGAILHTDVTDGNAPPSLDP